MIHVYISNVDTYLEVEYFHKVENRAFVTFISRARASILLSHIPTFPLPFAAYREATI